MAPSVGGQRLVSSGREGSPKTLLPPSPIATRKGKAVPHPAGAAAVRAQRLAYSGNVGRREG
jgi:hypothetical protein